MRPPACRTLATAGQPSANSTDRRTEQNVVTWERWRNSRCGLSESGGVWRSAAAWGLAAFVLWVIRPARRDRGQALPPLVPESLVGSVSFDLYCASCHGRQGRGDGPTGASLRTRPADLTLLARNNRGTFPRDRVLSFVEGSARAAAHGSPTCRCGGRRCARSMRRMRASPCGCRISSRSSSRCSRRRSGAGATAAAAPADGAVLFRALLRRLPRRQRPRRRRHGRPVASHAAQPHDLRERAMAACFRPSASARCIDGTGVASHGDRDMPVWGAVFKRLPVGGAGAEDSHRRRRAVPAGDSGAARRVARWRPAVDRAPLVALPAGHGRQRHARDRVGLTSGSPDSRAPDGESPHRPTSPIAIRRRRGGIARRRGEGRGRRCRAARVAAGA